VTSLASPAAPFVPMARRVSKRRRPAASRVATIVGLAILAAVAMIGALHPLSAAGGAQATAAATTSVSSGVGTVWGTDAASGDPNWIDLIAKGTIVLALLFVTLRVLNRSGVGAKKNNGQLKVLESRTLASKASLHLVAIGDRRLVVGLTPSGMVSLAELDAAELETEAATDPSTDGAAAPLANNVRPTLAASWSSAIWPIDAIAGRISLFLNGVKAR